MGLRDALPYLEKSLSFGVAEARYAIGMAHLSLGDKERALEHLELYRQDNPNDKGIEQLLDTVRNGKIEVKKTP